MEIESVAYWSAFAIPVVLLVIGAWIDKLVDGTPFHRRHFFMGIDLTIYFMTACMVNFLDLASGKQALNRAGIVMNVFLVLAGIVMLLIQMGIHQEWKRKNEQRRMQVFMLCYFCNALAGLLLYGFVKMKVGGLI